MKHYLEFTPLGAYSKCYTYLEHVSEGQGVEKSTPRVAGSPHIWRVTGSSVSNSSPTLKGKPLGEWGGGQK